MPLSTRTARAMCRMSRPCLDHAAYQTWLAHGHADHISISICNAHIFEILAAIPSVGAAKSLPCPRTAAQRGCLRTTRITERGGSGQDAHQSHVLRSYRSVCERDMSERSTLDCAGRGAWSGIFCELCCIMRSSCVTARWYPTRSTCRWNASVCMPCFTRRLVMVH